MTISTAFTEVPRDPVLVASEIQRFIKHERDCLPKEMNGRPKLCSDPRAVSIRKKMENGQCAAVRSLLIVSGGDVRDGVPVATALAPYRQMMAFLQLQGQAARPRDLSTLELEETKAQGALDVAQHRVRMTPDDPAALRSVITALAHYETCSEALRNHYEARLMIAAGTTQRPMALAAR